MSRTLYVKKNWFQWLQESCLASSGEGGSLLSLRRSHWGNDAYVIRCNKFLFMVNKPDFDYVEKISKT